ncbi:MAG: DUF924 family protein [Paracoccaceae bacterium]
MPTPEDVNRFWLEEVGPKGWYAKDDALDATIRDRFVDLWEEALANGLHDWLTKPRCTLAYIILTDQFPRNMFRESPRAFATDRLARAASKRAIERGWDLRVEEPERQFFYMPLMHSECLTDQDRCVRLMLTRMPRTGADNLLHAKVHREVIREFGRFPFRNAALSRGGSADERAFVEQGGYGRMLEELRA